MDHLIEKTIERHPVFKGNVIEVENNLVELPNGKHTHREIVYHRGAIALLAVDDTYMYFVKQFRISTGEVLLEIPAGKIEHKESPSITAKKELKEEIGGMGEVEKIYEFYVSPGFSNEFVYLYETKHLTFETQALEADEFLDVEKVKLSALKDLLNSGKVRDAKTLIAIQHYLLNC